MLLYLFVDTRCSKRFKISSQDSVYSIFNPISRGVSILLLQGLPSLPRLPKVFGKVLFLTPYYHGQTFKPGFSIEGGQGKGHRTMEAITPPPLWEVVYPSSPLPALNLVPPPEDFFLLCGLLSCFQLSNLWTIFTHTMLKDVFKHICYSIHLS